MHDRSLKLVELDSDGRLDPAMLDYQTSPPAWEVLKIVSPEIVVHVAQYRHLSATKPWRHTPKEHLPFLLMHQGISLALAR